MLLFINNAKEKEGRSLTTQIEPGRQRTIADELIDNAIGLPVESQDLVLMMAKAMQHTRQCIRRQEVCGQSCENLERSDGS